MNKIQFWDFFKQIKGFISLHKATHIGIKMNKIINEGRAVGEISKEDIESFLILTAELSERCEEWCNICKSNKENLEKLLKDNE